MTKTSIIDVHLSMSIDDIISEDVAKLTGKAVKNLDEAIAIQKKVKELKDNKNAAKQASDDKLTAILDKIYTTIEDAKENGVSVDDIMQIGKEVIPNTSALTLRIKTMLRKKNNPYRLERKKSKGIATYYFEPYNEIS